MTDRHARFREWLPDHVLRQLDEQGPVPLFSPSVANAEGDKENVIPFHHFHHSTATPTPRRPRFRGIQSGISPATTSSQETLFFTPLVESIDREEGSSTLDFSLRDDQPVDFTPFSVLTHSALRPSVQSAAPKTPLTTPRFNELSSTAFAPPLSTLASTPYKSLPRLDMLSTAYLNSCTDVSTLQQIIRVLQSDPKHKLPHLLHVAQARLQKLPVCETKMSTATLSNSFRVAAAAAAAPTTLQDSFTLSTDSGDEEGSSLQLLKQSVVQQHYHRSRPSPLEPTGQTLFLRQQLQQTDVKLQQTTQELEELQQLLQTSTMQHDQSTIELQEALASLQSKLDQQRRATEQSQVQEATYRSRVDELTRHLEQQRHAHNQAHSTYEQKQQQLSHFLKSSQRNLDVVTSERSSTLKQMLQAMYGYESATVEVDKLTKEERDKIVADFCLHLANSKSQLEDLAATIRATEKERRKILKAYNQVKERYIETHKCMVGLERDNHFLTSEIESLSQKLKETEEYADRVVVQQSQWDKRHQESKAVIRHLKEQIRTSETMVPLGIYKAAIETADTQQSKAEEYRKQVARLTTQVSNLTARLSKGMAPPPPPPPPPPPRILQPIDTSKGNRVLRTPFQPQPSRPHNVTPIENQPPSNQPPSTNSMSGRKVSFSDQGAKCDTGNSKVRAFGGRKALEEHLRRARSPRNQQL